ncbi:hypothetical protein BO94DRAFT_529756 [Aspergillus sclerotioniger CBS 115572]|uniref:Prolyl 4-hydroxylase alpha subunit domain-containing protein n=1 Tax=Aspergillus sclerotioniger CBS 115572 TaxID=1450535 RepID=A0A317XCM6_9EURO|nr:hypothetical protein BO94DRAFT_529756 [Aspergillus sclerotioniger CBS 115572]PWY96374.1 hypothetical protein BO94DRAFT_529756 [Aspergillus sclerotioniger CBS 115572]
MDSGKSSLTLLFSASLLLLSALQIGQWASKVSFLTSSKESSPVITSSYDCHHEYTIEFLSLDPLVMYINNFISEAEINHLLSLPGDKWKESLVYLPRDGQWQSDLDKHWRSSKSSMVPARDPVSRCLSKRMRSLLGNIQHEATEPLQLVRYDGGERFRLHQDWLETPILENFTATPSLRQYNRLLTSFVYLEDNCTGGETYFPLLVGVGPSADGEKFSRAENNEGLLVKPKRGNAVLWNNMFMNGTGDRRLLHSSLPVKSGRKIGMNLFSLFYLDHPIVGEPDNV